MERARLGDDAATASRRRQGVRRLLRRATVDGSTNRQGGEDGTVRRRCKYPPAKPGALELEPLEAAGRSINEPFYQFNAFPQALPHWDILQATAHLSA